MSLFVHKYFYFLLLFVFHNIIFYISYSYNQIYFLYGDRSIICCCYPIISFHFYLLLFFLHIPRRSQSGIDILILWILSINISTCRFECPIFEEIPLEITNIYDSFDEKSIFMLNSEKYDFDLFDNMFWWVYNMNMILICRTLLFHSNPKKSTTLIRSIKIIVLILVNVDF